MNTLTIEKWQFPRKIAFDFALYKTESEFKGFSWGERILATIFRPFLSIKPVERYFHRKVYEFITTTIDIQNELYSKIDEIPLKDCRLIYSILLKHEEQTRRIDELLKTPFEDKYGFHIYENYKIYCFNFFALLNEFKIYSDENARSMIQFAKSGNVINQEVSPEEFVKFDSSLSKSVTLRIPK